MFWNDPFAPLVTQLTRTPAFLPAADVTVSETDMVLTLDLPGLSADDLSIELLDGHLHVRGERRPPELAKGTAYAHSERTFGRFERRIRLPEGIDGDRIMASMENGVLSLIVPKPERLKPKTISVGAAQRQDQLEAAPA